MRLNLAKPSIARPVATILLTLGLLLAGIVAFRALPVAPLPQIDVPTIVVNAALPGASPETMAATVAMPLERALGTIAGVTEMSSQSGTGSTRITLQFDLARTIDSAARDVQAAINASLPSLPSSLPRNPTYQKVNPADQPVMLLSLTSQTYDRAAIYDAASTLMAQRIAQINGVGNVDVAGGAAPSVRIRVKMDALLRAGLSLDAVRTSIAAATARTPTGMLDDGQRSWFVATNDQLPTPQDYRDLIIRWQGGAGVRLGDVAEIEQLQQDVYNVGLTDGVPSVQLQIFRQPGANIIETVEAVRELLPRLIATLPAAIDVRIVLERTSSIRGSLREVERALVIAVLLVVGVVFLFLRSWRATVVPAVAVPVSLVSTFSAMWLLGYSLDNLSLMALTVATGFVVDDAVVVLENCIRHLERGLSPLRAVLRGTREVGFTVVSMSVSLVAVFIPILAMGGLVGRYFREFAVTLAVAIGISMLVSLTVTPMLCALLLKRRAHAVGTRPLGAREGWRGWLAAPRAGFEWLIESLFQRLARGYARTLDWALDHAWLVLVVFIATVAGNVWLYVTIPKGFFPQQDIGLIGAGIGGDQSMSFAATSEKVRQFMQIVRQDPAVQTAISNVGGSRSNGGFMWIVLKPRDQRGGLGPNEVMDRLRPQFRQVAGSFMYMWAAGDVRIGGRQGDGSTQFTLMSDDLMLLRRWEPIVRAALSTVPEITDVNTDSRDRGGQVTLTVDREALARLGLTMAQVDAALNNAFGQRQIATIYREQNQYTVVMEADTPYLTGPASLQDIALITPTGDPVPLAALATWTRSQTALAVNRQGGFASTTVSFDVKTGVSLGEATAAIRREMERIGLPGQIVGSFEGNAGEFQKALANQPVLILAALIAIYIVLGILYESFLHPLTILSTLPSAGVGALLALMAFQTDFTVIAMIGVVLLIGIVKKNAIMMVDFAVGAEARGATPRESIREACRLRLRPILMTTLAAMFGALPLVLGSGDGAELRQPLGITIVGGLIASQVLTLYTTPVIYLLLDRWRWRLQHHGRTPPAGRAVLATEALR